MCKMIACPQCGHHFTDPDAHLKAPVTHNSHALGAQPTEVALLQEQVRQLDDLIYRLNEERASLLRSTNAIQSSTKDLPPEILSKIFQYARPPVDFNDRDSPFSLGHRLPNRVCYEEDVVHIKLGSVSHLWRQVVCSTPQLWNTVSIQVDESIAERTTVAFLALHFQRSGNAPMSLGLDLTRWLHQVDSEKYEEAILLLEPLGSLVFVQNPGKIRELHLSGAHDEWVPYVEKSLTNCESLTLFWEYPSSPDIISLGDLPCLRQVQFGGYPIQLDLPWSTITVLKLYGASSLECMEILIECPNLIQFENINPTYTDITEPMLPKTVVLETLEILKWHVKSNKWAYEFSRRFRFAKLKLLSYHQEESEYVDIEDDGGAALRTFFSDLPSTLQCIQLPGGLSKFRDLKNTLGNLPHLEELHYGGCSPRNIDMLLDMVGHPISGLFQGTDRVLVATTKPKGPRFLPALKTLYIQPQPKERYFHALSLAKMLERVYATRPPTEPFHIVVRSKVHYIQESKDRITGLLERGVQLEVVQKTDEGEFVSAGGSILPGMGTRPITE